MMINYELSVLIIDTIWVSQCVWFCCQSIFYV